MSSYGLKTNIAVNFAILLLFGMGLTAFVTTNLVERILVLNQVAKGKMLIAMIEDKDVFRPSAGTNVKSGDLHDDKIQRMIEYSGASCVEMVYADNGEKVFFGHADEECRNDRKLENHARRAAVSGKAEESHTGSVLGVFWTQKQSVLVSFPLQAASDRKAGLGLKISLSPIYDQIRKAQSLIFIYILINGLLLTIIGLHQVSKVAVKPIHRLLKRAEAYQGDSDRQIFEEREGNEFNKLSTALNTMLDRISDHRRDLEKTVLSLEKANQELKKAQSDIIRAEKLASVGRLSSGIAHEIGNPLGIVSGYLELLKNADIEDDMKQDFIRRAESELARIDRIIKQLLNYSRASSPQLTEISVHDVIREVTDMVKVQPLMAGVTLELGLEAAYDRIRGDMDQMRQVLLNLSINALDAITQTHGKIDGLIRIETWIVDQDGGKQELEIHVKDNGTGIPKDMIGNIFDPFFTTKEPGKGTGLGLSVCFTIVQDMGGRIHAASEEGKGTDMILSFPLTGVVKMNNV